MGDIKKKRKLFSRPKKLYDRTRMDEENVLVKRYGLKNKREIWKTKSVVSKLRRQAKALIGKDGVDQRAFFEKLNKMGLKIVEISDVLGLTEENLLDRRLQTIVFKKKLANTPRQARQFIVHKSVLVDGGVVDAPSFLVTRDLEDKISVKERKIKAPKAEAAPTEDAEAAPTEDAANEEVKETKEAKE